MCPLELDLSTVCLWLGSGTFFFLNSPMQCVFLGGLNSQVDICSEASFHQTVGVRPLPLPVSN